MGKGRHDGRSLGHPALWASVHIWQNSIHPSSRGSSLLNQSSPPPLSWPCDCVWWVTKGLLLCPSSPIPSKKAPCQWHYLGLKPKQSPLPCRSQEPPLWSCLYFQSSCFLQNCIFFPFWRGLRSCTFLCLVMEKIHKFPKQNKQKTAAFGKNEPSNEKQTVVQSDISSQRDKWLSAFQDTCKAAVFTYSEQSYVL